MAGVAREAGRQAHSNGKRAEGHFVPRKFQRDVAVTGLPVSAWTDAGVRIVPGEPDHTPVLRDGVPLRERRVGTVEPGGNRLRAAPPIRRERARDAERSFVAPFAVGVQPFDGVEWQRPVAPAQLVFRRVGVRHDAEPSEPRHVVHHVARLARKAIRGAPEVQRPIVAAGGADLDRVDDEDAGPINRSVGLPRAVAVIHQHDELQPGASGGGCDLRRRAGAIRPDCVHVQAAAHRERVGGHPGHADRTRGKQGHCHQRQGGARKQERQGGLRRAGS
jgi:hypothetical protein